jgi:hypothetical protein
MASWRDVADEVFRREAEAGRADPIDAGVARLSVANRHVRDQAAWKQLAADANMLLSQGWVQRAKALGWVDLDLFGISPDGGADFEGLAPWLAGDRLVLLDATTAIAARDGLRRVFNRPKQHAADTIFVWELGR